MILLRSPLVSPILLVVTIQCCHSFTVTSRDGLVTETVPVQHAASHRNGGVSRRSSTSLGLAQGTTDLMTKRWFFPTTSEKNHLKSNEEEEELTELERRSLRYAGDLIRSRMGWKYDNDTDADDDYDRVSKNTDENAQTTNQRSLELVKGRFLDLTCTIAGEIAAESLFENAPEEDDDIIRGAIIAIQSLLILGSQVGVRGSPNQIKKSVSHLRDDIEEASHHEKWDRNDVRRLKHDMDFTAATQLLAEVKKKRTAQGAFDLLVKLGVFGPHEELALLRSGFPTRFTDEEEAAAKEAAQSTRDPDELLGIRQDFSSMKVYTIDGKDTSDVDDGLSVEVLKNADGTTRNRYWIHIADADRWATRDSGLFEVAKKRATSVYLPSGSVPMFPSSIGNGVMSLRQGSELLCGIPWCRAPPRWVH